MAPVTGAHATARALCLVLLLTYAATTSAASLKSILLRRQATIIPQPYAYSASQFWEGNDGNWSSFPLRVGTPPQVVRVFPSTTGYNNFIIDPRGCDRSNAECPDKRGGYFRYNDSSTWQLKGVYELGLLKYLGYGLPGMAGTYGYDNVTLGWTGSGGPTVDRGIVADVINQTYWLGQFGLNPQATNFTLSGMNDPQQSFMGNLRSRNLIPSLAYGYTAGAIYRQNGVFGSLTLGGYDAARFINTNVTFPFYEDISRDLLVNVQSIKLDARGSSLGTYESSFAALIDSSLPFLYLPEAACKVFETAFSLTWTSSSNYYLVDSNLHNSLLQQNPTVTLTLGPEINGGATVAIPIPYAAFDLNFTYYNDKLGIRNGSRDQGYFPIRRAANSNQYVLGRAFLQEAYLIADYDRRNFTIAPARWDAGTAQQKIRSILNPDLQKQQDEADAAAASKSLSGGAIAGIVIGALAGIALLTALIVLLLLRRRRAARQREQHKLDEEERLNAFKAGEEKPLAGGSADGSRGLEHDLGHDDTYYGANGIDARRDPELSGNAVHEMAGHKHGAASEMDESSPFLATSAAFSRGGEKNELEAGGGGGGWGGYGKRGYQGDLHRAGELEGSTPDVYELDSGRDAGFAAAPAPAAPAPAPRLGGGQHDGGSSTTAGGTSSEGLGDVAARRTHE